MEDETSQSGPKSDIKGVVCMTFAFLFAFGATFGACASFAEGNVALGLKAGGFALLWFTGILAYLKQRSSRAAEWRNASKTETSP